MEHDENESGDENVMDCFKVGYLQKLGEGGGSGDEHLFG